jgi:uncharacterized protein
MARRRIGILVYLAITFGATWAVWLGAGLGLGLSLDDPQAQLMLLPFFFTPAIAAVIVRKWVTRDEGGLPRCRPAALRLSDQASC